ncbi:MAG TPA: hypothetical protein PKC44_15855, partial [Agitococcus sp.]|nr:hypothetical protein [Agitococcus sp.]
MATIWNKNNTAQVVLTGTAIDDPIFNGTVKVMTPDGVEIGKATTKVDGTFSVSVAESFLSAPILLQVSGGTMAGQPFTGTLKAIYTSQDGRTGLNLTPVTTLVSHLANAESGSDLAAKRNTVLNKLTALGMVDLQSWRKVTDTPFDLGTIAFRISDLGGITQWVNTVQADIADGELSKNEMMMGFPKAHGGVQSVNVDKYLTLIPGKQFMLTPQPDGLAEGTNWQIKLYNAPEWVSVENNIIKIAPSAAQAAGNLSFDVELIANGVAKGRKVTLKLEVLAMTTLLQGQLGATGGKIENQWKDIALEAPAGALKQTYDFTYLAGVNKRGEFYSTFNTTPTLSSEEAEQLTLIEPQSEEIITNYLTSTSSSIRSNISAKARIESNMTPSVSFDGNVAGGCGSEPEWGDYSVSTDILKGDGFIFSHILQGNADWFDVGTNRRIPKMLADDIKL